MIRTLAVLAGTSISLANADPQPSLPLPAEIAAEYPVTALDHEVLVRTREGCGMFVAKPDPTTMRVVPTMAAVLAKSWSDSSWDGVCSEGLALGPGRVSHRANGKVTVVAEIWALRGRAIGRGSAKSMADVGPTPREGQSFHWKGEGYWRNVARAEAIEPGDGGPAPMVGVVSRDPSRSHTYMLQGAVNGMPPAVVLTAVTPKYVETGSYFDRLTRFPCPGGCGALWVEKAGPAIRAQDEFERQHAGEVAAVKALLEPMLKPLQAQHQRALEEAARREAEVEAARARQAAERDRARAAEQAALEAARTPPATPSAPAAPVVGAGEGRATAQQCEARKQFVMGTRIPDGASITASQETVMFMTATAVEMIDDRCPEPAPAERESYVAAFQTAQAACDQVQSGGRRCEPINHFPPGRPVDPATLRSPTPRIPVPKMPVRP